MGIEIERKYRVQDPLWKTAKGLSQPSMIVQGYISRKSSKQVRIRIHGDKGYLTIKGKGESLSRPEFEYQIPVSDAQEMLESMCNPPHIVKNRYYYRYDGKLWEIDEFLGHNYGLVVAEIELESEVEEYELPKFVRAEHEVTGMKKYGNVNLCLEPFSTWGEVGLTSYPLSQ
jgi:CYTH domain-containing protein